MGRKSRNKGARIEREVVHVFQEAGLAAERVPLSGAMRGSFAGDVWCPVKGIDRVLEVKCRADGFKQIYDWLAGHYGLVIRRDRDEPLIVLRLSEFAELAK
jgi:hypothetical protein